MIVYLQQIIYLITDGPDANIDDDDDVSLIKYNMAVGYKIYLHTNTDQPERHK
jgi:hypothetical protein